MKERGVEVGRVGAWYDARAHAMEVREIARENTGTEHLGCIFS